MRYPVLFPVLFILVLSNGCILSTHHAKVKPGWSGRFIAGARDETLDPPEHFAGWEHDDTDTGNISAQVDFGYGKRFSRHRAFYALSSLWWPRMAWR